MTSADPHVVYRAYDADDRLLYVGRTWNLRVRMNQHRAQSAWFPHHVRIETTTFPGFVGASLAEYRAIREDRPLFNRYDQTVKRSQIDTEIAAYLSAGVA